MAERGTGTRKAKQKAAAPSAKKATAPRAKKAAAPNAKKATAPSAKKAAAPSAKSARKPSAKKTAAASKPPAAAKLSAANGKVEALELERDQLKEQLADAMAQIARLQEARDEAVNRIDWAIDSLHNVLEKDA
ncbi:MAG TPA: hypothetical protein VNR88_13005 [Hyphomicrobium sp.]|nr:hypothetical protein [Hyphomicrobium sp.]